MKIIPTYLGLVSPLLLSCVGAYSNKNNWIPKVDTETSNEVCRKLRSGGEEYESLSPDMHNDFIVGYGSAVEYEWNKVREMGQLDAARVGVVLVMGSKYKAIKNGVFALLNTQNARYIMCTFEVIDKEGLGEKLFADFVDKMTNVQYHLSISNPVSFDFNMRRFIWEIELIHRFVGLSSELRTLTIHSPDLHKLKVLGDGYAAKYTKALPLAFQGLSKATKLKTVILDNFFTFENHELMKTVMGTLTRIQSIEHMALIQPDWGSSFDFVNDIMTSFVTNNPNLISFIAPNLHAYYIEQAIIELEKSACFNRLALRTYDGPLRKKVSHLMVPTIQFEKLHEDANCFYEDYINTNTFVYRYENDNEQIDSEQIENEQIDNEQFCKFMEKFNARRADIHLNHIDLETCGDTIALRSLTELILRGTAGLTPTDAFNTLTKKNIYINRHALLISQNRNLQKLELRLVTDMEKGIKLEYLNLLFNAISSLQNLKELLIDIDLKIDEQKDVLEMIGRLKNVEHLYLEYDLVIENEVQLNYILKRNLKSLHLQGFNDNSGKFWSTIRRCSELTSFKILEDVPERNLAIMLSGTPFPNLERLDIRLIYDPKQDSFAIIKSFKDCLKLKHLRLNYFNTEDISAADTAKMAHTLVFSCTAFSDRMESLEFNFGSPNPQYDYWVMAVPGIFRNLKKLVLITHLSGIAWSSAVCSIPMLERFTQVNSSGLPKDKAAYYTHGSLSRFDL